MATEFPVICSGHKHIYVHVSAVVAGPFTKMIVRLPGSVCKKGAEMG